LAVSRARTAEDGETRKQGALNRHAISPVECVIALFGCDEIALLAVAIEIFSAAVRRPQARSPAHRGHRPALRLNGEIEKRSKSVTGASACAFSTMPIAVTPIGPCAARRIIAQSAAAIINDGRGQLATACVLG
jgi:hypothetical protein